MEKATNDFARIKTVYLVDNEMIIVWEEEGYPLQSSTSEIGGALGL